VTSCENVLDVVERLAEGEAPDRDVSAHLQECRRCAAALALARQIHHALETQPVASPSPGLTSAVVGRTRSLRWQSEQRFDWWFNAATAASLAIIALGIWGLMNVTGLAAVTVGTADFVGRSVPALYEQVKPEISLYLSAAMLVAGGLAIWWWLERGGRPPRTA
jgi:anti-sigma factor RsiW